MQLDGHDEAPVRSLIESGVLEQPLHSPDWLQTAEVLESIDLLVSVDTSVAHLAGALGIPTVLMLSAPADWRWGKSGSETFLYDAMSLALRCPGRLVAGPPASEPGGEPLVQFNPLRAIVRQLNRGWCPLIVAA